MKYTIRGLWLHYFYNEKHFVLRTRIRTYWGVILRSRGCSSMIGDSVISSSRWVAVTHGNESSCWSPFLSIVCESALCNCCCCWLRHGFLTTLWHFLCTSNLHWMHLNPCRPRPQIRSWQKAQKALCEAIVGGRYHLLFIRWRAGGVLERRGMKIHTVKPYYSTRDAPQFAMPN